MWLPIILEVQINRHCRYHCRNESGYPSKGEENGVQCRAGTRPVGVVNGHERLWQGMCGCVSGVRGGIAEVMKPGSLVRGVNLRGRIPHVLRAAAAIKLAVERCRHTRSRRYGRSISVAWAQISDSVRFTVDIDGIPNINTQREVNDTRNLTYISLLC